MLGFLRSLFQRAPNLNTHRYCAKCGQELTLDVKAQKFDRLTGVATEEKVTAVCPNYDTDDHDYFIWVR
jgi:hypothetical protein